MNASHLFSSQMSYASFPAHCADSPLLLCCPHAVLRLSLQLEALTTTQADKTEDLQQQLALKTAAFGSVAEQNASLLAENQQVRR